MEQLPNGYLLQLAEGTFPLSTDSMVLSSFVRLPRKGRVMDLGAGCGTLGLLLCAVSDSCHVTGVELDRLAHETALKNIARNGLETRMESICCDLRQLPKEYTGRFDCCSPAELFESAAKALKFGGDFFLVHKPERLAELIARGSEVNLEAKRLLLLRHKQDGPITLIFLQFRKGGKPGLIIEESSLFDTNNEPTAFYKSVYHITEE